MYLQTNRKTHQTTTTINNEKKNRHNIYLYIFLCWCWLFFMILLFAIYTHTHTPHSSSVHFFMLILRWLLLMCRFYFISFAFFPTSTPHPTSLMLPAHFKKQTNKMNWKYDTFVLPILWSHKQRLFFCSHLFLDKSSYTQFMRCC